jgi:hypothetical protein
MRERRDKVTWSWAWERLCDDQAQWLLPMAAANGCHGHGCASRCTCLGIPGMPMESAADPGKRVMPHWARQPKPRRPICLWLSRTSPCHGTPACRDSPTCTSHGLSRPSRLGKDNNPGPISATAHKRTRKGRCGVVAATTTRLYVRQPAARPPAQPTCAPHGLGRWIQGAAELTELQLARPLHRTGRI